MSLIQEMFELQCSLNEKTNGEGWIKGITKEGREINWNRCIYTEAIEALDSFNWKHWKTINAEDNWDNLLVELVDIWHFLMSEAITLNQTQVDSNLVKNKDKSRLITAIEMLAKIALDNSLHPKNRADNLAKLMQTFFLAIHYAGMDINELYRCYVVKNQLNIFRQNHGYKDGLYQKMWQGKEDNVVAFELMNSQQRLSPDELYEALELAYRGL